MLDKIVWIALTLFCIGSAITWQIDKNYTWKWKTFIWICCIGFPLLVGFSVWVK